MLDAITLQTLATKLDTRAITLKEAKAWVKATYNIEVKGHNKDTWLRNLYRYVKDAGNV